MIRHVPFADLTEQHLTWLAESMLAAPEEQRPEAEDFARGVMLETMRLFEFAGGLLVVSVDGKRLKLEALRCRHLDAKTAVALAAALRRLAADWECDTIETIVFDSRLAFVIERLGGRVESWTMVLPVEKSDG